MATTERPKSRLPDGRVNPEYTAWRKKQKRIPNTDLGGVVEGGPEGFSDPDQPQEEAAPVSLMDLAKDAPKSEAVFTEARIERDPESAAELEQFTQVFLPPVTEDLTEDFQSAAEPEQTNSDDLREPEVAPALEAPLPVEVDSNAGSSPAPADGDLLTITVDRIARNKSFVYGALDGELVPIRVKKKTGPKLVGKPIRVQVTHEAGHTLYTHAP